MQPANASPRKRKIFSRRSASSMHWKQPPRCPSTRAWRASANWSMQCMQNSQAKALQHVFFAERKAANVPNLDKSVTKRDIKSVAIIGAGTMGGGIAMNFLNVGIPVTVLEMQQDALDRGVGVIRKNYENTASKGKLTLEQIQQRMAMLKPTLAYADVGDADLVIEAVFETMAIKKDVFGKLDKAAKKGAILASNTSYLSIDEIADATSRPSDVVGMHFFSPANVMRLLEIVRGAKTAQDVLVTVIDAAKRINKVGVVCGNRDGFIGNRMLGGYAYQASLMVLEGAMPEQVDAALRNFRHAHGRAADERSGRTGCRLQVAQGPRPGKL